MLLTSFWNNLLRLLLFYPVTLLLHLITLLLHHMAILMHCYLLLLKSARWHKVTIFLVLLCKLLLLHRNVRTDLVVQRPVPTSCSRGLCQTSWCKVLLLNWLTRWASFG